MRLATLCGEAADVPEDIVADWAKRLPSITAGYAMNDIYNADETGLYFRALPNRSMVLHDDPSKGIKTSKERITVLLACSAAGHKLKPLVIGKAENPRSFRGFKRLLRYILAQMDEASSATELAKRVNLLDAIPWLHLAWAGISKDCVRKCFTKCSFHPVDDALLVV